ncbi:MAG: hypothetical protein ACFE0R_09690 [Salinarimonas sp.]
MRLLSALVALLIALSVVVAPLPGAFGAAHAGAGHAERETGTAPSESACVDATARDHGGTKAHPVALGDLCADAGDAAGGPDRAGCCDMATCQPLVVARAQDAHLSPPVAIAAAWWIETLLIDARSSRIERPPRA